MKSKAQIKKDREIARLRARIGLPQIKKGRRNCLGCDKKFYSQDLINEKCCEYCRRERS